ncbi:hypothetical protein GZ203_06405 [Dermatophilus congolensis]|nr:hypothetical protein [Dermatophilus congolensis]
MGEVGVGEELVELGCAGGDVALGEGGVAVCFEGAEVVDFAGVEAVDDDAVGGAVSDVEAAWSAVEDADGGG